MKANDIIISIRPEHVNNIMAGRKTVELRRRFPERTAAGRMMLIYSSSPDQALIGAARIERVRRMTPSGLWRSFKEEACVPRELFNEYFAGTTVGFGVILSEVVRFDEAITVSELKARFRFSPPQSYCYLRGSLTKLLKDERIQIPNRHEHRYRSGGQSTCRRRAH